MLGSLLKVLAYRQAPKTTFAMLHPDAAFQLAKMRYDFHHAYAPRVAAVAAAAVALPLGIILGRAFERGARRRHTNPPASIALGTGHRPPGRPRGETQALAQTRRSSAAPSPRPAASPRSIRSQMP